MPVYALIVAALVTLMFIWVGSLNSLAPIVTMPFLLTYAAIDYAYFALAQTKNMQEERDERFKQTSHHNSRRTAAANGHDSVTGATSPSQSFYGSTSNDSSGDLDELFPERVRHRAMAREQSTSPTSPVPGEDLSTAPVSENGSLVSSPSASKTLSGPAAAAAAAAKTDQLQQQQKKINIGRKSHSWYSPLCNRWVSFFGVGVFFSQ